MHRSLAASGYIQILLTLVLKLGVAFFAFSMLGVLSAGVAYADDACTANSMSCEDSLYPVNCTADQGAQLNADCHLSSTISAMCPTDTSCTGKTCSPNTDPKYNNQHYFVLTCQSNAQTYSWAKNFLVNFLDPFYTLIIVSTRLIGIFLVFVGITRLRRMGQQNMMHRTSPAATTAYFFVGCIFTAFMPELLAFSNAIFGSGTIQSGTQTFTGSNPDLTYACSSYTPNPDAGSSGLASHVNCPVLGYYNDIVKNQTTYASDAAATLMQVVYAILLVVGLISFLRGCLFLLKLGEGNSQESSVQKAVVHMVAGMIGMNAEAFQTLISGVLP